MDDLVDALRPRLEQLAAFFGLLWDLDGAFDIVSDVFAAHPAPPGTKAQWEYFQLVMDELDSDAVLPPFDALWRSYARHPEPLDWEAVLCRYQDAQDSFPEETASVLERGQLIGTNEDFAFTRTLERIGLAFEDGDDRELKLITGDAVTTYETPTDLLDAVLAAG